MANKRINEVANCIALNANLIKGIEAQKEWIATFLSNIPEFQLLSTGCKTKTVWFPCDSSHIASEGTAIYLSKPDPACEAEEFMPGYGSGRRWDSGFDGYKWTFRILPDSPPPNENPCIAELMKLPRPGVAHCLVSLNDVLEIVKRHQDKGKIQ